MEEKLKKLIIIISIVLITFAALLFILYIGKNASISGKLINIITPDEIVF